MSSDFDTGQTKPIGKKGLSEEIAIAAGQSVKEREYWLKQFPGEPVMSAFPYDYSPTGQDKYDFHQVQFRFTGNVFHRLMALRNDSDYTLHMVLTAAVVVLLYKCTGNHDIIVGSPVDKQEEDTGIEFINNVLALRNTITGFMTFKELLLQVRQTILDAVENQNYPFETLLYDLNISTADQDSDTGSESWLFDAALLLENIHDKSYLQHIHKNILFCFRRTEESVELVLEYNSLLYHKSTAERLIDYLRQLMSSALFNVDLPLMDIDILPEEERHRLLVEFNDTFAEYPLEQTLHGLFEEQVEKTPDNIALVGVGTRFIASGSQEQTMHVTYRELNEKSQRLAGLLREKGVQPDNIAAVMLEQSLEMVIGILAILKAGGAYMPIDPDYPVERINYMLSDSGYQILLTIPGLAEKLSIVNCQLLIVNEEPSGCRRLNIPPKEANSINNYQLTIYNLQLEQTNLAYTIYTSGSTGTPKGVLVEHGQVVNTLVYRRNEYNMTPGDTSLQLFSYTFDGFLTSFFTPIISGAKVVFLNWEQVADINAIRNAIVINGVTHFISVPALYRTLLEGLENETFATLKTVTLAGDTVSPQLVELTKQKNKHMELAHEYGVTEAAVMSTLHRHQERDSGITIGQPISNTCIYILDRRRCPQPIGIPGELCIGGAGVARGYLNNPELTAQKFDRDLWDYHDYQDKYQRSHRSHKSYISHRSYRTGDLARWQPDGNIEFLGRIDHQVKIRGIRVELEEIETQLINHEKIKDIVVTTREDKTGNRYLCAYWVPDAASRDPARGEDEVASPGLTVSELQEYLSNRLPASMIPAYFVEMEEIPLTSNGKADRKALPEPGITPLDSYIAPGNEIEKQLAGIWAEVLAIEAPVVGIDDNFFELGGHSLLVNMLVLKIEQCFQVRIPFTEVFQNPTIRQLSQYVANAEKKVYQSISPVEQGEYYPVSAAQKRMYLENQFKVDDTRYNTPNMILIEGSLDTNRVHEVVKAIIRRHEILRTSFHLIEGIPVQRVHQEVELRIQYMQAEENQLEEIVKKFIYPFDLAKVPLLRINLVNLPCDSENGQRHIFMYDMHHIVGDGLSISIFFQDLMDLYEGVELPELKIQYKDFTFWQNDRLQSDSLKSQEKYWLEIFSGELPVLDLPVDFPRPALQHFEGETIYFYFNESLSNQVKKMALESGGTLFSVLLAIFNILLSRYSTQEDIIVGTPTGGRPHMELEHLIGMFVNTLAIRNQPNKEKTFSQLLQEVQGNSLKAFENQDYQFEELVNHLGKKRDLSRHVLFNVMFAEAVANKKLQGRKIKDLLFKPYKFKNETIPFDLVLYALDYGETIAFKYIYCTRLFKKETIERMADHFTRIAESVIDNPDIKVSQITLVSHEDKEIFMEQSSKEMLKNVEIEFDF